MLDMKAPSLRIFSFSLLALLAFAGPAMACSIPVFRYALQFWEPSNYEVVIFHKGELSEADAKRVRAIDDWSSGGGAAGDRTANLIVRRVDVADSIADEELAALWQRHAESSTLPTAVVRFPKRSGTLTPVAVKPLAQIDPKAMVESAARRTMLERLAAGDTAVWLLVETDDKDANDAAFATLEKHLRLLETTLKLPEAAPEDDDLRQEGLQIDAPLKIAFSSLRVKRTDSSEAWLIDALLRTEDDLLEIDEPMVFAVYGRGRALPALIGKGITGENIATWGEFLTGPCSCQIKEENPGVDLLVAADWQSQLMKAHAALGGYQEIALAIEPDGGDSTGQAQVTQVATGGSDAEAVLAKDGVNLVGSDGDLGSGPRNVLMILAIGALVLVVATALVLRKPELRKP